MISLGPFSLFPYRFFLILLWLIFLLNIFKRKGQVSIKNIKVIPYLRFFILWFFYAVLSLFWAAAPMFALREIVLLFIEISMIFFVVYYFTDIKSFKLFYNLWLLIIVISIGFSLWNYFVGNNPMPNIISLTIGNTFAPKSFYKFQNFFSIFLALSIPFVLTFIKYHKRPILRLFFVGILLLAVILLLLTLARSCYLAVFSSIVFWMLFTTKRVISSKTLLKISLAILILFILFQNQYIQALYHLINEQITSLDSGVSNVGSSVNLRLNAIKNSLLFFKNSWGLGVGAGNVEYYMVHFGIYNVNNNPYVHNWWVEILTNYGIFIFGYYITLYVKLFLDLYKVYAKLTSNQEKMICETLLMGMVGFPLASLSNGTIIYFAPQWIFFAFVIGFLNYTKIKRVRI